MTAIGLKMMRKHEKYTGSIGNDSVRLCTPDAAAISGE